MTEFQNRYLSDIKEGEEVVILKVKGYGAFRKRITEMGFNRGATVKVIRYSPLKDPIEYELMGYHVSLRRNEAQLIKVISKDDAKHLSDGEYNGVMSIKDLQHIVKEKNKNINVALVGNPNCGKTTLYNQATNRHEHTGNYGGVTVDVKTAELQLDGYNINLTDLPGTYSLSEYSPEELYVREHLSNEMPDVVVNVIDASNLERNLYLTTQLIDMNVNVILVLNMYDELEKSGSQLDYKKLSKLLGCPIIPTIATKKKGLRRLLNKIIAVYEGDDTSSRHIHINYGIHINSAIQNICNELKSYSHIEDHYHARYVAIKLIEGDSHFEHLHEIATNAHIKALIKKETDHLIRDFNDDTSTIISDAKYGFIRGALKETYVPSKEDSARTGYRADLILTNKWLGIPSFLAIMWAMFQLTFSLGAYPMNWIDSGISWLSLHMSQIIPLGMMHDLIIDGIIGGIGGVIIFLPNILILFFCISLMEDTGYMARTAFIMDRAMHKIGLHGKSFIPMLMGFGCNVPAIMATRTLENRKDRIITMMIIPFMSCSARLPVYVLLTSAFFVKNQGSILLLMYIIGIALAALLSLVLNRIFFNKEDVPFVMELPPYRTPTTKNTAIHMWEKSVQYLSKMGGIILIASILIWALGYFPRAVDYSQDYDILIEQVSQNTELSQSVQNSKIKELTLSKEAEHIEASYIGRIGHTIEPVIRPLGFDWRIGVSLLTGVAAKEIVVSSMAVLYQSSAVEGQSLKTKLQEQRYRRGERKGEKTFSPIVAFSLMLFILIYFPCVAVIAAIKRELSWNWALFTMFYTTGLAWLASFAFYQIASLL
ncbi:MAG: ferrous iron transport protein B [Bacteroidales bacterium]|nr:ferrous iron transport protein B [Bacteroidales bacterium]